MPPNGYMTSAYYYISTFFVILSKKIIFASEFRISMTISLPKDEIIQQDILQAASQLFQKYGLNKVTMDDIARAVGKGRSSLYYYYKNREEIFDAVMIAFIQEISREISEAVRLASTLEEKLEGFCWVKLKTSKQRHSFFRALESGMGAEEISKHTTAMTAFHFQLMQQESVILKRAIEDAVKSGEITQKSKKEIDIHIFILLSSIRGIKREALLNDKFTEMKKTVATLCKMMVQNLK